MGTTTPSTATNAQRDRVLQRLKRGPATTLELRRDEDVIHPAGRVRELRNSGHSITTLMLEQQTDSGAWHRVGQYVLRRKARAT